MNSAFVPGGQDAALKIEDAITKSATYAGTAYDMGAGFAPGAIGQPMAAVVDVTAFALGGTTGASTWTATLMEATSSGGTYTACGADVSLTATGAVSVAGIISRRYVKLKLTLAGATGTGTVSLSAWINPNGFASAR